MRIQESGENYLETILILEKRNGYVRSIDIANELDFTKPSVSRAMGIFKKEGLINVDGHGHIMLTEKGRDMALKVYDRHTTISRFLHEILGISKDTADTDACRIEHIISEESFRKIKQALIQ